MMNTSVLQMSMILCYLAVSLGISFLFTRRNTGTKAYFLAKGNLGVILCVSLLVTECISAGTLVGAASTGFSTGLSSVWASWGQVIGIVLFILFAARFFRIMHKKHGVMSIAQCYEYLFDRRGRLVMLFVATINYCILFSVTPAAVARMVSPIIHVSNTLICWAVGLLFILITITGGLGAIAWMNVINLILIFGALIAISTAVIGEAGGLEVIRQTLPPTYFDVWRPTVMTALAGGLGTGIAQIASSCNANIAFSAKTYKTAKISYFLTAVCLFVFALFPSIIGIAGKVLLPDADASTILYTIANHVSPVLGGLAAMVTAAACFSSGPAFMLLTCTTITRDFYCVLKPEATDQQQLFFSRMTAIVLGLIFTFFGSRTTSLLNQILGAFQIRSVVGIVLIVGVLWKGTTKSGAFWGMLLGGIVCAGWFFAGNPWGIACLWPGAAVTLLAVFGISIFGPSQDKSGYEEYHRMLEHFDEMEQEDVKNARA